ncbi:YdcF family protein [Pararobbsia silviterrae]|uniref:YdcF family protein n=1 Tax=Pararobbsia silviterrae TaxID=1792498 RepID=UPI001F0BCA78|nr:YdcF family protein [Pararobbsia silviterrae]
MRLLKLSIWVWLIACVALALAGLSCRSLHTADVAVVPGNTVYSDGRPSPRLTARLSAAWRLYAAGRCKIIFVSGGTGASGVNEATAMRAWLIRKGVPPDAIVEDDDGVTTWATARHAGDFIRQHHFDSAIAVTQYFHVPRTMVALKRFGVHHVTGAYPDFWEARDVYSIAREVPAWVWYASRPMPDPAVTTDGG